MNQSNSNQVTKYLCQSGCAVPVEFDINDGISHLEGPGVHDGFHRQIFRKTFVPVGLFS